MCVAVRASCGEGSRESAIDIPQNRDTDLFPLPPPQRFHSHAVYAPTHCLDQRCADGDAAALHLDRPSDSNETFFPDMLEGDLVLSYNVPASSSAMTSPSDTGISISSNVGGEHAEGSAINIQDGSRSGVIWIVSAMPQLFTSGASMMSWTIFPSSGLLLPGKRCVRCDRKWCARSGRGPSTTRCSTVRPGAPV